jgi:hypothetical protein
VTCRSQGVTWASQSVTLYVTGHDLGIMLSDQSPAPKSELLRDFLGLFGPQQLNQFEPEIVAREISVFGSMAIWKRQLWK